MNTLTMIVLATLLGGLLSMVAAAGLAFRLSRQATATLVAFSAGVMLSSALLDILPEAFTSLPQHVDALEHAAHAHDAPAARLFAVLLAGLLGFFALERLALWRHAHAGCDSATSEAYGEVAAPLILIGDAFHNFVDGLLIAAAFLADPLLGWSTTLAIIAHEVPQEAGDFAILLAAGWKRGRALFWNGISSLMAVAGGIIGFFALDNTRDWIPVIITIAASSFLYIAIADLMPRLKRETKSVGWHGLLLAAGIAVVAFGSAHSH